MFLKMMGPQAGPDDDSRIPFTLFDDVVKVQFGRMLSDKEAKKAGTPACREQRTLRGSDVPHRADGEILAGRVIAIS